MMQKIHQIDSSRQWTGSTQFIAATSPIPAGWIATEADPAPGQRWSASGWTGAPSASAAADPQESLLSAAKARRDAIASITPWGGSMFQTRVEDAPNILGAVMAVQAGNWPAEGIAWRLADNSWRVMLAADMLALFAAASARKAAAFAAFAADEALILAGGTLTPNLDALEAL